MQTAEGLEAAMAECCNIAIDRHCAETIIIGGGPMDLVVKVRQNKFNSCLILDPVLCAVKSVLAKIVQAGARCVQSDESLKLNL